MVPDCADGYNALLGQAKASLVKGDRGAAINSLIAAKIQLRTCQELEERNSIAAVAVALNSALIGPASSRRPALPNPHRLKRLVDLRRVDVLSALQALDQIVNLGALLPKGRIVLVAVSAVSHSVIRSFL